jgi:uncharacterized protein YecE (DUF72 family)
MTMDFEALAPDVLIGTAGWSIPRAVAPCFPEAGTQLERYARRFSAVEINSSFHRPHRLGTYERWAAAVPPEFRFAVKLPKSISHVARLVGAQDLLDAFAAQIAGLGDKLAVVLVQLPPSFAFEADLAGDFFIALRGCVKAMIACEPRHPSWFADEANACLDHHHVARVAADPVIVGGDARPGGWPGLRYHRLHGAPRIYHSAYDEPALRDLALTLGAQAEAAPQRWCMFDNTASGAAAENALTLGSMMARDGSQHHPA